MKRENWLTAVHFVFREFLAEKATNSDNNRWSGTRYPTLLFSLSDCGSPR